MRGGGLSPMVMERAHHEHYLLDDPAGTPLGAGVSVRLQVLSAFAMGQAMLIRDGEYHPLALGWLSIAIAALAGALLPTVQERLALLARLPLGTLLVGCAALQLAQLLMWNMQRAGGTATLAPALAVSAAGLWLAWLRPGRARAALVLLVVGHVLAGAMVIRSTPAPDIDVWHFQQHSPQALLRGEDPYAVRYRNIYGDDTSYYASAMTVDGWLTYSYPYPPLNLLLAAPARWVGDVRWAHLAAVNLAAVVLVVAGGWSAPAVLAAAMMLLMPRSLLVIERAWTEPMVVLAMSALVLCAARAPRAMWLALGGLIAIKQYMVLALPLVLTLSRKPRSCAPALAGAAALALGTMLPFILWNPIGFVRSVALWQLHQPFRSDALSFAVLMDQLTGVRPGLWLSVIAAAGAMGLVRRYAPRTAAGFALSLALVMVLFFATSKQAFCNYYFFVMACLCAAVAVSNPPAKSAALDATEHTPEQARLAA
jgi:hypothetical protein